MSKSTNKNISVKTNNNNHLLIEGEKSLKGKFSIGPNNSLVYSVIDHNKWRRKYGLNNKLVFEGKWSLNEDHNLILNIQKSNSSLKKGTLVLRGDIIDQKANKLIFKVKSKTSRDTTNISYLSLKGIWQADKYNRIIFQVNKSKISDILTLKGIWDINKYNQISYTYSKLKRKSKKTVTFDGYWQITGKKRIQYVLSSLGDSYFDFKVHLQTNTLYPSQSAIKYRIGIGIAKQRKDKTLTLYGQWKFNRKLGVFFEMKRKAGKKYRLEFGTAFNIKPKDKITISLVNEDGKSIGATLQFAHKWLKRKDAQTFLRLQRLIDKETSLKTGVRLRF